MTSFLADDATLAPTQAMNQIEQIMRWFQAAVPDPENVNLTTQTGVHLEEVAEMLEVFIETAANSDTADQLTFFKDVLAHSSKRFKNTTGGLQMDLRFIDRVKLLDALCDQIVTAVGIAHMFGLDIAGGLREVANSNDSKFDDDGRPIFNSHRKIMKGPRYVAPDLTQFV